MTALQGTAKVASVEAIRAHFPALQRQHGGHPVAYFDGPGGTQVPRQVADAMTEYLLHHNANTHWQYPTSQETDQLIAEARAAAADFLNSAPDEIAFGANMTTLTFHVARGLGRQWGSGDEIIVTELDHHANVAPWRRLEQERGITIRSVPLRTETGQLDWPALERAIGPRTRLLAIGGASNALGTVNDLSAAVALARNAGALSFVDAVHYAPHVLPDVRSLGADFLVWSAYKVYGPHLGVLWGRRERLDALDVPKLDPAPSTAPEKLETGTQNHEAIAGLKAGLDFLASLAPGEGTRRERLAATFDALHLRGEALVRRMWEGLGGVPGVRRFGPAPGLPRTPTVSFVLEGRTSDEVARACAARGVFVSNGDFYATTVVDRLGYTRDGLVRAGCACYTTAEEIDRLVGCVRLAGAGGAGAAAG
jgi:cysteine desulfurase family protein (TIGR01976 family)